MEDWLGIAASTAGGGVFGILGTIAGRVASYWERKQTFAHEVDKWAHETKLLEMQMQAKAQETEAELALADVSGSWKGLEASMNAEAAIPESYKWVAAVRGLTRPALTILLWGITLVIFLTTDGSNRQEITEATTFAATAATLWWFGDRGPQSRERARINNYKGTSNNET